MVEFSPNHGQSKVTLESDGKATEEPSSRACHHPKSVYSSIPQELPPRFLLLTVYLTECWIKTAFQSAS